MAEQKRNKRLNTSALGFVLLIGIFIFKSFIWDEYIVNNTASAALDDVEGQPGVGFVINKNQEIAIKPYEEGFNVYAVSKGFWGWSVTDELSISDKQNKSFEITERTLQFKDNKSLYLVFVMDKDNYFNTVIAHSSNSGPIHLNRLASDNGFLFYHYSEEPFKDLIYEGTTFDGKVKKIN
ncbi:hypothetical protein QTL97_16675 [Sporosarcina thermotolerans]|uniref:Lipoprotein n=1 Tax=Sporosarcina thermotolerans TaxID=633404 RepID=A0AAW9AH91_9BACL|nr:hypothetical protein [Sporosarcina thermotolerans]MDW0118563.1 hypothetical protein [Sporosarcina thermotolerans]